MVARGPGAARTRSNSPRGISSSGRTSRDGSASIVGDGCRQARIGDNLQTAVQTCLPPVLKSPKKIPEALASSIGRPVNSALRRLGYQIGRVAPLASQPGYALELDFAYVLAHYLSRRTDPRPFYFVQVGAFDGVSFDLLHDRAREGGWHGVLIEPQPYFYTRLVENYGDLDGLSFVNAAIDRKRGKRPLYCVRDQHGAPVDSLGGLASFLEKRVADWKQKDGHRAPPGIQIVSELVECVTFEDVLADTEYIDLLHLDTEGYDFELLKLFDLPLFSPPIVRFEHAHLSREDWNEAIALLARHGYRVVTEEYDTTGYRVDAASTRAESSQPSPHHAVEDVRP